MPKYDFYRHEYLTKILNHSEQQAKTIDRLEKEAVSQKKILEKVVVNQEMLINLLVNRRVDSPDPTRDPNSINFASTDTSISTTSLPAHTRIGGAIFNADSQFNDTVEKIIHFPENEADFEEPKTNFDHTVANISASESPTNISSSLSNPPSKRRTSDGESNIICVDDETLQNTIQPRLENDDVTLALPRPQKGIASFFQATKASEKAPNVTKRSGAKKRPPIDALEYISKESKRANCKLGLDGYKQMTIETFVIEIMRNRLVVDDATQKNPLKIGSSFSDRDPPKLRRALNFLMDICETNEEFALFASKVNKKFPWEDDEGKRKELIEDVASRLKDRALDWINGDGKNQKKIPNDIGRKDNLKMSVLLSRLDGLLDKVAKERDLKNTAKIAGKKRTA